MPKFLSNRDVSFFKSIARELVDDVIQVAVVLYKINQYETKVNIYGESLNKTWYPGVEIYALADKEPENVQYEGFGPDRDQSVVFKFRELSLKDANFYPEVGDFILFNDRYHEVNNVVQEQLLGGQANKSHSIICNTHYSRLSQINLVDRQF